MDQLKLTGLTPVTGWILALQADGFQIGPNVDVNQSGLTYHYIEWKSGSQVGQGSYAGDGVDNRSIKGVGFQPAFVWVKRLDASQAV